MNTPWDHLWLGADIATMQAGEATGEASDDVPYGALEDGAIATNGTTIAWVGRATDLPAPPAQCARAVHTLDGGWITPGLIDCHTHLVHGGNRAREFEMRLTGATYEEIARAGGGIRATVEATREATVETLVASARPRLAALLEEGVTTVEIKSGYGLNPATERAMLRAARQLGETYPVTVTTTFLGAHALAPEFANDRAGYLRLLTEEMLPQLVREGLVDAVDAFCESIGFSPAETAQVFDAAKQLGLPVKLHADQLSDLGGGALAARYGALSADHLEYTSEDGIKAMAAAGTVAVLLPGAFYTLRETRLPPIGHCRTHGVPIAIATDCNPGSSPTTSLVLMINMACTLFSLTPEEALAGVTRHAARALGLHRSHGVLAPGMRADFVHWEIAHPAELAYRLGANPCNAVIYGGQQVRR